MPDWGYERPKRWLRRARPSTRPNPELMGDAGPWTLYLPAMWQAIADPTGQHAYPKCPAPPTWPHGAAAYWAPLTHLLMYSFGWRVGASTQDLTSAGVGLQRLLSTMDSAPDDGRVRFLHDVWGLAQLQAFASWALNDGFITSAIDDPGFREQVDDASALQAIDALVQGGSDPLHLTAHAGSPLEPLDAARTTALVLDEDRRTAVLMLDSYACWASRLDEVAGRLRGRPADWSVDIVVRPIGWLGEYRVSPDTGLWFSGDHELHLLGHQS